MACSKSCRTTSKRIGTIASKALSDGRTSETTKKIAGSALAQRKNCK